MKTQPIKDQLEKIPINDDTLDEKEPYDSYQIPASLNFALNHEKANKNSPPIKAS